MVRYNGHAVVVTSTAGWRGSSSVHELNQELLLYAAFLNETINHLSGNITTALIGTDRPPYDGRFEADGLRKASMLREGFLAFHAKYYHFDVTHRAASRQLFDRVIERSEFRVRYGELENELDRLHQIEQGRTERLMQHILFALGLAGIVEMTAGIASLELMGIRWVAIFTFVLLMSAIGTYGWVLTRGGFHRGRRRLPPGERETARRHLTWPTKPAEITEQPPADAAGSARTEPPVESSDELVPGT